MANKEGGNYIEKIPQTFNTVTRDSQERVKEMVGAIEGIIREDFSEELTESELLERSVHIAESLGIFKRLKVDPKEVYPELVNDN